MEGESIFISPLADGSRIDIKGDSARRGKKKRRGGLKSARMRRRRSDKSDPQIENRAKKRLRDHRREANFEDGER